MVIENLPLGLLNKHRAELDLKNPVVFEHENDLFTASRDAGASIESAVVFLPKSKALIDMTLALVSGMVAPGGTIVLAGANHAGIRSAKDAYEKNIGPVDQKIVGNHSALYVGKNAGRGAGKTWKDFLSFSPLSYTDKTGTITIEVAKLPGVFSAGELDEGTQLLLDYIPYDRSKILDIGCGAGVIGTLYARKNPKAQVTMTDSSMIAVKATEETMIKNGVKAETILSDVFSNIQGAFDLIVTNPPFHSGIETNYSFIENFAREAKKHLNKDGEVYVVANSFLPYEKILAHHIGPTEILIDTKKFRVYRSKA